MENKKRKIESTASNSKPSSRFLIVTSILSTTIIEANAFEGRDDIVSIVIPDSVTSIGMGPSKDAADLHRL